jgi:hypothetical protein
LFPDFKWCRIYEDPTLLWSPSEEEKRSVGTRNCYFDGTVFTIAEVMEDNQVLNQQQGVVMEPVKTAEEVRPNGSKGCGESGEGQR